MTINSLCDELAVWSAFIYPLREYKGTCKTMIIKSKLKRVRFSETYDT